MGLLHNVFMDFVNKELSESEYTPKMLKYLEHAFHAGAATVLNQSVPLINAERREFKRKEKVTTGKENEFNSFLKEKVLEKFPGIKSETIEVIASDSMLNNLSRVMELVEAEKAKHDFSKVLDESKKYADKHFVTKHPKPESTTKYDFSSDPNLESISH